MTGYYSYKIYILLLDFVILMYISYWIKRRGNLPNTETLTINGLNIL